MNDISFARDIGPPKWGATLFLVLVLFFCGCQAKEPPLSPAEASFKKEVQELVEKLSPPLIEPVSKHSTAEINVTLQKFFSDPENEPRTCPFKFVITDKDGVTLAKYPVEKGFGVDFSSYELVQKVLQEGKTAQGRFFLQDGSKVYVICAPLQRNGEVIGILALAVDANQVGKTCGLAEAKFLAIDFNRP
jgi:hypothetical protein